MWLRVGRTTQVAQLRELWASHGGADKVKEDLQGVLLMVAASLPGGWTTSQVPTQSLNMLSRLASCCV